MAVRIGVLGLQGDFALHARSLRNAGADACIVRTPAELKPCRGLVVPGGESTTFANLLRKTGMFDAVLGFAESLPILGTCAGLIVLSTRIVNDGMDTLGLIDLDVERNAYGRQVDSFIGTVSVSVLEDRPEFEGVFIRAPKIRAMGKDTVVLGVHQAEVVMVRNRNVLATTFHPELTDDPRLHGYFIEHFVNRN